MALTEKQKKKISKLKEKGGSRQEIQALREKFRTKQGMTATKPGENFGTAQSLGNWASSESAREAMQNSMLGSANQTDIYGNTYSVTIDPNTGQPTITQNLSGFNQNLLAGQQGYQSGMLGFGQQALTGAQSAMSQPYGYDGISNIPGQGDIIGYRSQIEKQLYDQQANLMEPQFKKDREDFEQMAAERAWVPGSAVYNDAKARLEQSQNQSRQQWAGQATQQGLAEMQGLYGMSTQDRARQIAEMQDLRYGSLNEAQQFYGAAGAPQVGQFQAAQFGQMAPTNYANLGLGYSQMGQEYQLAQQQMAHDMNMLNAQLAGKGGGGGGEQLTAEQQMQLKLQFEQMQKERGLGQYFTPEQPASKTNWGDAIGGIAQGIGNVVGTKFFG